MANIQTLRQETTPPHVQLRVIRQALGMTVDEFADRILDVTGKRPSRGTISAIENGRRGASQQMIEAMEAAYGLPAGSIVTDYRPRRTVIAS